MVANIGLQTKSAAHSVNFVLKTATNGIKNASGTIRVENESVIRNVLPEYKNKSVTSSEFKLLQRMAAVSGDELTLEQSDVRGINALNKKIEKGEAQISGGLLNLIQGGTWKGEDGKDIVLPAGEENQYVEVATEVEAPVTIMTEFNVDDLDKSYCIGFYGFNDCEIYINGNLFRKTKVGAQNYEPSYSFFEIYDDEAEMLKEGLNEIRIKVLPMKGIKTLVDIGVFATED